MGGAERNARKKRQQRTSGGNKTVAAARKDTGGRRKLIIGAVVVVVLAAAVIGGVVFYNNKKNATEGKDIAAADQGTSTSQQTPPPSSGSAGNSPNEPAELAGRRKEGVVVVGKADAKVKLDVYEDFLCPACRVFEETYGKQIDTKIKDGTVQVRYHMLPMLNDKSDPAGYSMDSANAGLCAADAGKFPAFHVSLYNAQPEEGTRGWDRKQLAKLGTDLGITTPEFSTCVDSGQYNSLVQANFDEVRKADYLQQEFPDGQKGFGTPTIAVGEKVVNTADKNWLDKLIKSAA